MFNPSCVSKNTSAFAIHADLIEPPQESAHFCWGSDTEDAKQVFGFYKQLLIQKVFKGSSLVL